MTAAQTRLANIGRDVEAAEHAWLDAEAALERADA